MLPESVRLFQRGYYVLPRVQLPPVAQRGAGGFPVTDFPPLPDNIKETAAALLKCNPAELQWLQMGMGLLMKRLIAAILQSTPDDPLNVCEWCRELDSRIALLTREDMAKFLIDWANTIMMGEKRKGGAK